MVAKNIKGEWMNEEMRDGRVSLRVLSHLEDWDINTLFLITLLLGLNGIIMHVKWLDASLAQRKTSMKFIYCHHYIIIILKVEMSGLGDKFFKNIWSTMCWSLWSEAVPIWLISQSSGIMPISFRVYIQLFNDMFITFILVNYNSLWNLLQLSEIKGCFVSLFL